MARLTLRIVPPSYRWQIWQPCYFILMGETIWTYKSSGDVQWVGTGRGVPQEVNALWSFPNLKAWRNFMRIYQIWICRRSRFLLQHIGYVQDRRIGWSNVEEYSSYYSRLQKKNVAFIIFILISGGSSHEWNSNQFRAYKLDYMD